MLVKDDGGHPVVYGVFGKRVFSLLILGDAGGVIRFLREFEPERSHVMSLLRERSDEVVEVEVENGDIKGLYRKALEVIDNRCCGGGSR